MRFCRRHHGDAFGKVRSGVEQQRSSHLAGLGNDVRSYELYHRCRRIQEGALFAPENSHPTSDSNGTAQGANTGLILKNISPVHS